VKLPRRLLHVLGLLMIVIAGGTAGYVLIEGWTVFDSLYMTMITIASVGFMEVHELSTAGRAFTMGLISVGLGAMAYGLSAVTAFWVEGDLGHIWERRKMDRHIATLRGHIIVCGGGDTGRHLAQEFLRTKTPFVVIEVDPAREAALQRLSPDILYIIGDGTEAEVLTQAGVNSAFGLISAMPADKDNVFAILTARDLNPNLRIVSRVMIDESRPKLARAGADAVVSHKAIGALRLASEMVRPNVVNVLDAMLRTRTSVRVEEVTVGSASAGRTLGALRLPERLGIVVFAVREAQTQEHHFNPPPDRVLASGDVLIACMDPEQLGAARKAVAEA
jgi:voltage-gated potassium channel